MPVTPDNHPVTDGLDQPRPEYPRPQLRRERWESLNGEWAFGIDTVDAGLADRWYLVTAADLAGSAPHFGQRIVVPFSPHAKLSGVEDFSAQSAADPGSHDVVWYARTITRPKSARDGDRLILRFGAVDYRATVWVNGIQVAEHVGGHTPFSADITDALVAAEARAGALDVVVVRAEDHIAALDVPRGKQYWLPESEGIFYTPTIGIWQSVWLEPVSPTHLAELFLTPDVPGGTVDVRARIDGGRRIPAGATMELTVTLDGRLIATESGAVTSPDFQHRLVVRRPDLPPPGGGVGGWDGVVLWTPESPTLYDLCLVIRDADGTVLDEVDSYLGMRSIEVVDGQVLLNGKPYFQRLVLDQGYFPGGVLTAPTDEDLRRDIEIAKELGFNGARKHQKVEDPRWHYWADRLGFLVWGEMANAYAYSREYVHRITDEWQQVLRRDHNHPSIVAWVPMNESWAVPRLPGEESQRAHLNALYHLTRSLDPSRLVISNDGWEHGETDLLTLHDYRDGRTVAEQYGDLESAVAARAAGPVAFVTGHEYSGQPILVTECGGIAYAVDGRGWGYTTAKDSDEFLTRYRELIEALVSSPVLQGFCYTQLTDVEQEINGLLTFDRIPKVDRDRIRDITQLPR